MKKLLLFSLLCSLFTQSLMQAMRPGRTRRKVHRRARESRQSKGRDKTMEQRRSRRSGKAQRGHDARQLKSVWGKVQSERRKAVEMHQRRIARAESEVGPIPVPIDPMSDSDLESGQEQDLDALERGKERRKPCYLTNKSLCYVLCCILIGVPIFVIGGVGGALVGKTLESPAEQADATNPPISQKDCANLRVRCYLNATSGADLEFVRNNTAIVTSRADVCNRMFKGCELAKDVNKNSETGASLLNFNLDEVDDVKVFSNADDVTDGPCASANFESKGDCAAIESEQAGVCVRICENEGERSLEVRSVGDLSVNGKCCVPMCIWDATARKDVCTCIWVKC